MIRRLCLLLALASPAWADHFHAVKHHVAPVAVAQSTVSYDTSIGTSVDANGRASLPLHTGASRYYVNSSTGSDSNSCATATNPATPKATVSSGLSCAVNGNGDQILIAQGTSYTGGLTVFGAGGFSAQYPTVIESYDPTDPTNEAKLGTAGTAGRPVLDTGGTTVQSFMQGSTGRSYFAIRGLDFNPGNILSGELKIVAPTSGTFDHILFENNIFHYTQLTIDNGASAGWVKAPKVIIRGNSFYASYGDTADHEQGIFISNTDGSTIEDNVFWHNGWKAVGSSSFTASISGETMTVSAVSGGNLVTGQLVGATGIDSGTFVTAFGTGTGGAGNYTLGTYQTVSSSTAMTGGTVGSSSFTATVSGRTLNVSVVSSGSIVNGQVITASGLLAGTTITNQQSGTTGQAGKYTIDVPQTISSEAMTGSESRSMPSDLGGDVFFNHAVYSQVNNINSIARRNVTLDSALETLNMKGGGIAQENLSLRNPSDINEGGGDVYSIMAPFGVYEDASYNAQLGSNIVNPTSGCVGCGVSSTIGRQNYSLFHHNVIARNDQGTGHAYISAVTADVNNDGITLPAYVVFDHNVSYLWSASGSSTSFSGGMAHATATNNVWDDPASGSNVNVGSVTFPNAYTETSLLAALPGAYPDEATAAADWRDHPENHGWENAVPLMLAGYGVTKAQMDLTADLRFTAGVAQSGQFIGTLDGYTISATGMPSCMTIDDSSKAWRTDTTCTVGSGTASITETNGSNTHVTSIPWTVYAQPVLSSLSVTPGTTTATINVSASVGSGTLYVMVSTVKTTLNSWGFVRANVTDTLEPGTKGAFGSNQAVTATGAQPAINVTGLTTATAYRAYLVQVDANNNVSAITTFDFTTN